MSDDRCVHDFIVDQCGICRPRAGAVDFGLGRASGIGATDAGSKQDSLTRLCSLLGIAPLRLGVGSSVPSELFDHLVTRFQVPRGPMPEVGEAVVRKAGLSWDASCDSRSSGSGGGSTVTAAGLERLASAVSRLTRPA